MLKIYLVHKVTYPFDDFGGQYPLYSEFVEWSFSLKKLKDKYWLKAVSLEYSDLIDNGVTYENRLGTTYTCSVFKLF